MKKRNRIFMITFLAPALICFILLFVYPIIRTTMMSFFEVTSISDPMSKWSAAGINNYIHLFNTSVFQSALINILKIWFFGGLITMVFAMLFAVILESGVKFKNFWRSVIYLPNIVVAVAMANMWLQYVYNSQYGLFKKIFGALGLTSLANINWTAPDMLFISMLIAYCFGCIGYFMLILMAGMERIPQDLYESAFLDGASAWKRFRLITFPLIRNVFRTCIMLWTVTTVNFFVWSQMFSRDPNPQTITPVVYMYNQVFGPSTGIAATKVGIGSAVGVLLTLIVLIVSILINKVLKERKLEY